MGNQMVNYSVFMMQNPIHPEKGSLAYAKAQVSEVMSFRKFVQHIAEHGGYTRGKVKGVISDMCTCLVEMLLEGKKVQLDELGDFWISLSCEGAESCEKFTADNIKAMNIIFTPGVDFENLIAKAEFTPVASRTAQAATLKAEKAGKTSVDLEAAKKKGDSAGDNAGGSNSSDDGGTAPDGGGSSSSTGAGDTEKGDNTGSGAGSSNGSEDNAE